MAYTQLISGFIALILTLAFVPRLQRFSIRYRFMLDPPSEHKIHQRPVPRVGGISMAVAFALALISGLLLLKGSNPLTPTLGILAAGLGGLLLGICDDLYGLKAYQKFTGQIGVTIVLLGSGFRIEQMVFPFFWGVVLPGPISLVCTLFWVAATMNAINLIDGVDGLAAGLSLIAALGMLFLATHRGNASAMLIAAGIAGVCLGFLRYNFHPASIFMGDCGSMFLGATFAGLSLLLTDNGATPGSLWIPITFLTVPFLDTTLAIIRRKLRGQRFVVADKEHLHNQLLDFGLSQRQTVVVFYTLGLLMGAFAIACFYLTEVGAMSAIAIVGLVLLACGLVMTHLHHQGSFFQRKKPWKDTAD